MVPVGSRVDLGIKCGVDDISLVGLVVGGRRGDVCGAPLGRCGPRVGGPGMVERWREDGEREARFDAFIYGGESHDA